MSPPVWHEERVRDLGSEQRALDHRGNPVALHSRLPIWVDDNDLGPRLFRECRVLDRHRLVVRQVGARKHDQVGADPVGVRAGGGGHADCGHQPGCAGRMADPRAGIDVVGAQKARNLLVRVVRLVGDAAEVTYQPRRLGSVWRRLSAISRVASSQETTRKLFSPLTADHGGRESA